MPLDNNPLYAEGVHILNGLANDEMDSFLDEHPTINTVDQEAPRKPDPKLVKELQHTRDALDRELAISQCLKAST